MKTPFDDVVEDHTKEIFYLVETPEWRFDLTDGGDGTTFYDYSQDGRLFSAKADCPICNTAKSIIVSASYSDEPVIRDWVCLCCGRGGELLGRTYGVARLIPRGDEDNDWYELPAYIVIS
ncbi:MAG: hypothetical protein RBS96_09285 [Dehalococcoidales bacterium]|jgi:hypothetical protein|nr:hypothetical protein [Dehalococcoidales bacterium]MDX9804174.1 hypothetical protein [Dehalococcoidales bacterium]